MVAPRRSVDGLAVLARRTGSCGQRLAQTVLEYDPVYRQFASSCNRLKQSVMAQTELARQAVQSIAVAMNPLHNVPLAA